jgi:hypothetical protein
VVQRQFLIKHSGFNDERIRNSEYREFESTNQSVSLLNIVATAPDRVLAFAVTAVIGTFVLAGLVQVLRGFRDLNWNFCETSRAKFPAGLASPSGEKTCCPMESSLSLPAGSAMHVRQRCDSARPPIAWLLGSSLGALAVPQQWDVPPTPLRGDAHEDATTLAVGRALTSWEFYEEQLAEIFANADMAEPEIEPAVRAYGSVVTARGRADMLEAAGEAYFFKKPNVSAQADFENLLRNYRGFAGRRNDIAHGRVAQNAGTGFYLYPGLYNTNKYPLRRPPKYLYTSAEIRMFQEAFEKLYDEAADLVTRL